MDLSFTQIGAGRPIIVMHGLLGSARNWGALSAKIAAGANASVFTVDLPNHGQSPWSEVMDYPFMAREIARFIDAHCAGKAHVIGHSMGGKAAMMLALQYPEKLSSMVVVDSSPVAYSHTFAPYIKAMRAAPLGDAERRADVEASLTTLIPDPRVRAFLMQNLDGAPGSYRWKANLPTLHAAMTDILGWPEHLIEDLHYDGRSLFLNGGNSNYVKPEYHGIITQLFPNAEFHTIAGADHWVHADKPVEFLDAVLDFLG